jgi:hypothetical protein
MKDKLVEVHIVRPVLHNYFDAVLNGPGSGSGSGSGSSSRFGSCSGSLHDFKKMLKLNLITFFT